MLEMMAHNGSINSLAVHHNGALICLGKDDGTVALMELSEGFVSSPNMKVNLSICKHYFPLVCRWTRPT